MKFAAKAAAIFNTTKEIVLADHDKQAAKAREKIEAITPDKQGLNNLGEAIEAFFERNPEFNFVTWIQGTDEFNDGEPCFFSLQHGAVFASAEVPADEASFKELHESYPGEDDDMEELYGDPLADMIEHCIDTAQAVFGEADVGVARDGTIYVSYHERQNVPQGADDPFSDTPYCGR